MSKRPQRSGILIRILRRIFSVWFYFLFLIFFIVAIPLLLFVLLFNSHFTHNIAHQINKIWAYLITIPVGIRIVRENTSVLKRGKTYIFAANHSSFLDIPVCHIGIPISFRFMGKAELTNIPLFGWMFGRLHIPVNREHRKESYNSFYQAKEKLNEGVSVLVYPEGMIPDKKNVILGRFKNGAFRLAIENQVPIVPVILLGTDRALPDDGKFVIRPAKIRVIFADPIETKGMVADDVPLLKAKVYDLIHKKLTTP